MPERDQFLRLPHEVQKGRLRPRNFANFLAQPWIVQGLFIYCIVGRNDAARRQLGCTVHFRLETKQSEKEAKKGSFFRLVPNIVIWNENISEPEAKRAKSSGLPIFVHYTILFVPKYIFRCSLTSIYGNTAFLNTVSINICNSACMPKRSETEIWESFLTNHIFLFYLLLIKCLTCIFMTVLYFYLFLLYCFCISGAKHTHFKTSNSSASSCFIVYCRWSRIHITNNWLITIRKPY